MKKIISAIFIISIFCSNSYAENIDKNDIYNQQWNTVINLQRLLEANLINEAPNLFSKEVKPKIINMIKLSPEFFVKAWKLNEFNAISYKKSIFSGNGIFVFEDNEWKINEI